MLSNVIPTLHELLQWWLVQFPGNETGDILFLFDFQETISTNGDGFSPRSDERSDPFSLGMDRIYIQQISVSWFSSTWMATMNNGAAWYSFHTHPNTQSFKLQLHSNLQAAISAAIWILFGGSSQTVRGIYTLNSTLHISRKTGSQHATNRALTEQDANQEISQQ